MGKIKLIFLAATIIISGLIINSFLKFDEKLEPGDYTQPVFQVTTISENGKLFQDLLLKTPLIAGETKFIGNLRVKTDSQTSFNMMYKGTLINVLPNSYIYFHKRREALSLIGGEIYWKKSGKTPVKIYTGEDEKPLTLSRAGRLKVDPEGPVTIWSFKGGGVLKTGNLFIDIPTGRCLVYESKKVQNLYEIPAATTYISPKKLDVNIRKFNDFLVKIDWRFISGVSEYKVKLYSSRLRESLLFERIISSNRTGLELAEFEQNREFFWEVVPLNEERMEGEPSMMGQIRLLGVLINEERESRPPELAITSLTVNGNMVLIRGRADVNSELYVDDVPVKSDSNGIFIHTKRYKTLGLKQIVFRLVSPSGVESIETKQVTIFEE